MAETLKEKTARGLLYGSLGNGLQQVIGLLAGIMLGRLLSPDDYGMVAMITIFSLIASELQNTGFKVALTNLKEPTDEDYNSVFWFNITASVLMYVVLFFCAPLIAAYYRRAELVPLCRYAFIGFVIASFGIAQAAWLFKNLRAKQQAKSGIVATLLSVTVGVTMAANGCAYWSIATQSIVFVLVNTALLWHYSPWRPSFRVTFRPVRHMFRFSVKILLTGIFTHINNNVLNILLGRFYSAHATGIYNQAYQWNSKCAYMLQGMVQMVAQPVFVDVRDDEERRLRVLRTMMRFTAFMSFPMLLGFGLVSEEFIVLAITEKWRESAVLIKMLCVSGAFMPLTIVLGNMIMSRGKSDVYLWCTVALGVLQVCLMIALHGYGIRTMVAAYVSLYVLWFFVWHHQVWRLTGYTLAMVLCDVLPFALSAAAVMAATYYVTVGITSAPLLIAARVALGAALYVAVRRAVGCRVLAECVAYVLNRRRRGQ